MRNWRNVDWTFEQTVNTIKRVSSNYDTAILLDSAGGVGWRFSLVAGLGIHSKIEVLAGQNLDSLQQFLHEQDDYVFGHFGYDLKESTEGVSSLRASTDGFQVSSFFAPEILVICENELVRIGYFTEGAIEDFLAKAGVIRPSEKTNAVPEFTLRTSRYEYLEKVNALLAHIHRGDIYEINFCVEFFTSISTLDVVATSEILQRLTLAPYGGLYKWNGAWLLCGSPELYLRKSGNKIISQPIKGTRKRGMNPAEDLQLRNELQSDQKERSENIMIVDLVRNDLSRIAQKGSVRVTDLFGITSFKTVHQMSSTIECTVAENLPATKAIAATFPMGSMTGAPKIGAMEIADKYEDQSRGIYSGSIGYFAPNGDFEFNVVIRSIMWNSETGHLSVKAGSAITANSIAEKEYEECLLKAEAMIRALQPSKT